MAQGGHLSGRQRGLAAGLGWHDQIGVGGRDPLDDGAGIGIVRHQAPRPATSPGQGTLELGQLQPTGGLDIAVAGHTLGAQEGLNLLGEVRGLGGRCRCFELTGRPCGQQGGAGDGEGGQRKESATEQTCFSHDYLIMAEACHFLPQNPSIPEFPLDII